MKTAGHSLYLKGVTGQELVERFGKPMDGAGGDGKVDFQWHLLIDEVVVTFYVWKNYGELAFDEIRDWNLGGKSAEACEKLSQLGFNVTTQN